MYYFKCFTFKPIHRKDEKVQKNRNMIDNYYFLFNYLLDDENIEGWTNINNRFNEILKDPSKYNGNKTIKKLFKRYKRYKKY